MEKTSIIASGRELSIHGSVPIYLQWFKNWNADHSALFKNIELIPPEGLVIDVGANIGIMSCSIAVQRPDIRVIAIEPVPDNVECLRRNVADNDIRNIEVIHAAVSNKSGHLKVNSNGPWSVVLADGEVTVPAVKLDDFIARKPSFVKIDVEGWEPFVIAGGKNLFKECNPHALMEFNTWSLLLAHHDPISFSTALWKSFDIIEQYFEEKPKGAPTWDRQIVHDNITLFGSVSDILMKLKPGAESPDLDDMICSPDHLKVKKLISSD